MLKKFLLVFIILKLTTPIFAQTATAPAVGDGSIGSPYRIGSLANLYWISLNCNYDQYRGKYYKQTRNIDAAATSTWPNGWIPIGSIYHASGGGEENTDFSGYYDGNGFEISNLYKHDNGFEGIGLFYLITTAEVKNIGLVN